MKTSLPRTGPTGIHIGTVGKAGGTGVSPPRRRALAAGKTATVHMGARPSSWGCFAEPHKKKAESRLATPGGSHSQPTSHVTLGTKFGEKWHSDSLFLDAFPGRRRYPHHPPTQDEFRRHSSRARYWGCGTTGLSNSIYHCVEKV